MYVDDFKLSGPGENLSKGWDLIQKGIATDKPHKMDIFLGCKHEESLQTSPCTGKQVRVLTYNMQSFLEDAVAKYQVRLPVGSLCAASAHHFSRTQNPRTLRTLQR